MATRSNRHRLDALLIFLLALSLYLMTTGGSMATDIMSYEVSKNMAEHGSVAMSYNVLSMDAHRGVDGRYYAPYGLGHAVYGVPFYVAGKVAEQITGLGVGKPEALRKAFFVLGNAVAGALAVWLAFLFARRLGCTSRAAAAAAMTLGFATLLWPYAKMGFSAPLAALTVLWGTYAVWTGVRNQRSSMLWLAGVAFGCAALVRQELAITTIPAGVWILMESRWRIPDTLKRVMPVAIPVAAALALTGWYDYVRFGNMFDTGYLRDNTATWGPMWLGFVGLLFSPGRSLFLFAPVVALSVPAFVTLWRRDRATAVLLGSTVIVVLLSYSSFAYWDADRSYGPRYLVAILPELCVPLALWFDLPATAIRRRVLMAAVIVSVLAQIPGVLVDFSKVGYTPEYSHLNYHKRLWTWGGSGFCLNARAVGSLVPLNVRYLTGRDTIPAVYPAGVRVQSFNEQFAFSLDFWWLYLFYARALSASAMVAIVAVMALVAAGLWRALSRRL
jgi:hypothetical protein